MKNGRKIKSRKNRWESWSLTNANVYITKRRLKIVPKVSYFSSNQIVLEEGQNFPIESYFIHDERKELVIERQKKLRDIEC